MELIQQLKKNGAGIGACREGLMKLRPDMDVRGLVNLYFDEHRFCIRNDFPSLTFLRNNFKGKSEPYGVYIDSVARKVNCRDISLNGTSKAMLLYNGHIVANLYVRNESMAVVTVRGHAFVIIDVFDDAHLMVAAYGHKATVIVRKFGSARVEIMSGNDMIVVNETNKNTY